jgi:hypothetical protein
MNVHLAEEILNELGSSLEALETQNAALLQFLKDKGIVTDEQLAPYINQAGNASNVRWRAARVRLEGIFASATKQEEEKTSEKNQEQMPKAQANTDQEKTTNQPPENITDQIKSKDDWVGAQEKEAVETQSDTAQKNRTGNKTSLTKAEHDIESKDKAADMEGKENTEKQSDTAQKNNEGNKTTPTTAEHNAA